jgi:lipopolysaccharide export LptBFGC system permease protein LptF
MSSHEALPERVARNLLPIERRVALVGYRNWTSRLAKQRPGMTEENYRLAINAAYTGAAFTWMLMWVPLILAAAFAYSTNSAVTIGSAVAAVIPIGMTLLRLGQALRTYSGPGPGTKRT